MSKNGQGEGTGGEDLSTLSSFFFYIVIVHPITAWILRPGRFERKKSIMYAVSFLALIASVKTGMELQSQGPNYYSLLGVTRASNPLEIKRAYKKLSLQLHPDKNPSPTAADEFDAVKKAYDTLIDMEFREVYNKFGEKGVLQGKRFDETRFFIELGVFYVSWAVMAFVLTLGKKSGDARQWTFTGLILMLIAEVYFMTSQSDPLPNWLFPKATEYEAVWLLHSLFPAFMNGCRSIGAYLYVDLDAQTRALLLALQEQNKDILLVLRDVQIHVQNIKTTGTPTMQSSTDYRIPGGATPTGKLKELQERLNVSHATVAKAVNTLKSDDKARNSSLGFYAMIIGYIAFSYFFN